MTRLYTKTVAIIVAHPDDEILWVGGTILSHPSWKCFIITLCRRSDSDRAPKFYKTLRALNAEGAMGDLDDGPEQKPLDGKMVESVILGLLPLIHFDLVITHNPSGEYTKHLRHEEVSKAVINLWLNGKILTHELWTFEYEDGNKNYYPRPIEKDTLLVKLVQGIWQRKYRIMTEIYGFEKNSWEAETTPKVEAFFRFHDPKDLNKWLSNGFVHL